MSKYSKEYYFANNDRIKDRNKKWYEINKDKMKQYRDANKEKKKEYNKNHRSCNHEELLQYDQHRNTSDKRKRSRYFCRYSCALEENWLHYQSTTHCECCGALLSEGKRDNQTKCQDHDHTTGKLRGIICDSCNKIEGLIRDKEHRLSINSYLEKYGK